ncbi:helix-turn-helix transcriptional regulator [Peribacillus psychrosaccharolyticus]|uniref:Helix-turn-helix transcriptional regulator n=3 Tax=Peribacillus psychrosaccharolyticus TaxID=1407 RepID=A0A974RZZ1_PERPY|nr:helix-turn-helix transcriptional regulator [Peribacillus psychrosaccharolyticus]QQS99832.1 helix-turn-helix transcriptional regulator [Peribacillus psychrosaccharolyticus]
MMEIGSKLKKARLEKKLTQENVANLLNLSRSTISSWEVGRSYPDLDNLVAISDLYDVSLDILLREDAKMVKQLSLDTKQKKRFKLIISLLVIVIISTAGYLFMLEKSYQTGLEIPLNEIEISNIKLSSVSQNDADTGITLRATSENAFYRIEPDNFLAYVDDESIYLILNTIFDPLSIVAKKEISESNSFMAPDSFSNETKVYLIEDVKKGTIKLVGTIGTLTK